ncbi:MAG: hypothetical protein JXD23_12990 [Spirochaetales bacterium]|nr:hypothetical protein [Spirochaetales bacterium]
MLKQLNGIAMGKTWLSYPASAFGALSHARMWEGSLEDLAGFSGLAFHFTVHESACPSSTSVYDWQNVHFQAMDRIGVYTDGLLAVNQPGLNTSAALLTDALARIRESIDEGRGVVVWAPTPVLEFGIVTGYDDEERILSVVDCSGGDPDPLLYDNLGRSEVPFLYLQRFRSRTGTDREKMYRDALAGGVLLWRSDPPDRRYGNGTRAYDNLLRTLKAGDYNPFGLSYCLQVFADAKRLLSVFLGKAAAEEALPGFTDAAGRFERIAALWRAAADAAPFRGPKNTTIDPERAPLIAKNMKECKKLESEGMAEIAAALGMEAAE